MVNSWNETRERVWNVEWNKTGKIWNETKERAWNETGESFWNEIGGVGMK